MPRQRRGEPLGPLGKGFEPFVEVSALPPVERDLDDPNAGRFDSESRAQP